MRQGGIRFATDSPPEETGFELVWAVACQVAVFGLSPVLCSEVCPGKASMFSRRQSCRGKLCVGDREARAECQCGELIRRAVDRQGNRNPPTMMGNQVRVRLAAGGKRIRTIGPAAAKDPTGVAEPEAGTIG